MSDFASLPAAVQQSILNGPAMTPPDGVVPNFDNPSESNALARIIIGICLGLSSAFFFLRGYGVWFVIKQPRLSDYVMIPTYILFIAFISILFAEANLGYFIHQYDIRLKDLPPITYLYNCSISLYAVTLMMIKVVILLEWLYLFCPTGQKNYFYWTAHILMWINILFYSAAIIAINLSCFPYARTWDRTIPGTCISDRPLDITSAAINFLVDFGILVLPQRAIWRLKLSTEKRLGVSAVFSLGILAVVTALARTIFTIIKSESEDLTWDYSLVGLLLAIEITFGIIIFCLPVCPKALGSTGLPKLYTRLRSLTTSSQQKTSQKGGGSVWPKSRTPGVHRNQYDLDDDGAHFVPLHDYAKYGSESGLGSRN